MATVGKFSNEVLSLLFFLAVIKSIDAGIFSASSTTEVPYSNYSYEAKYEINDIFKDYSIIPDLVSGPSEHKVEVVYNDGDYIDFGNTLSAEQIKNPPTGVRWPSLPMFYYTLILTSPDYPSREDRKEGEWQYWLVGNIPGHDVDMGHVLTEYSPPTSLKGDLPHRFVFLVYEHRGNYPIKYDEPHFKKKVICLERAKFSSRKLAEKYNFRQLIAANFFLVEPFKNGTSKHKTDEKK